MPRDIPVGNGRLLVTFDDRYQLRDIYYPHVGQENHGGGPCRFGVWADVPGGSGKRRLAWSSESGWSIRQRYLRDTLTSSVSMEHRELRLVLYCNDVVDFHRAIFVRKIKIKNLANYDRALQVVHHQDFNIFGSKFGDTAYFDPELGSVVHYRGRRYLMVSFFADNAQRIDEFATGHSGFGGAEGTWRDAEDGHLQGNPIAQGSVDSTISVHVNVPAGGERIVYLVIIAGQQRQELVELHKWLEKMGPQGVIDRTSAYWRLWVGGTNINFGNLPDKAAELFRRSLLVMRTQIDNGGAILAANDSDIMQFSRDTYSYVWPRDGALVADALDHAGFPDVARSFYTFCQKTITPEGYFHHKYNPDGSPASSWHPWIINGQRALPVQEDETALVVWALWRHYYRFRDIEFIRPLWVDVVQPAADWMVRYRDPRTGLPLPSYDLWEERWGVHAFTVATVHGGLRSARNFAVCFGDRAKAEAYNRAADEIQAAAAKYLFSERLKRFVRRLIPRDAPTPAPAQIDKPLNGAPLNGKADPVAVDKLPAAQGTAGSAIGGGSALYDIDPTVDSALYAVYKFRLFEADDPRVVSTMRAIEEKLWVKTPVGGVARYESDTYHRISNDLASVPGNPWFICTLWMADYFIARATNVAELKRALPIFEWTASHALESGVLAEQVNPYTNQPISVSPLTWSHATVVSTVIKYLEKLEQLQHCTHCKQPVFHLRRPGPVEVKSQAHFDRLEAGFDAATGREMIADVGKFTAVEPHTNQQVRATLAIDTRDCIGCDVCIAHCANQVLKMVDGKAMIDLRQLNKCDLDGECVAVCPTKVVTLRVVPSSAASSTASVDHENANRTANGYASGHGANGHNVSQPQGPSSALPPRATSRPTV
jgi:GH15 family glucan-1,4-alpha-glucosidase/ferredoxin